MTETETKKAPARCLLCGKPHEDRAFLTVIPDDARQLYRARAYEAPTPPVYTGGWDEDAWCRWIDGHGRWLALA